MRALQPAERAEKAVSILRESALKLERFEDCFTPLAELFNARSFHLVRVSADGLQTFIGPKSTMELLGAYMRGGWDERDTWSAHAKQATRSGRIVTDAELIDPQQRKRDPFFQEFGKSMDVHHYAAWTFKIADQTYGFTLIRPRDQEFLADDIQCLSMIRSAAESATDLAAHLKQARMQGFAHGLEVSGRPSIVLDHSGRVSFMTARAETYVGRAFDVRAKRLCGLDRSTHASFLKVGGWIDGRKNALPSAFRISSPRLAAQLTALCLPLESDLLTDLSGAAVIISIVDASLTVQLNESLLMDVYELTGRECELAALLATGRPLDAAAQLLGLKVTTVRQMAKAVMLKMGVQRQVDLVALLIRLSVDPL